MDSYFNKLIEKLGKSFNIRTDAQFSQYSYDAFAVLNVRSEKYMLRPEVKIYGFENDEYFLIRKQDSLTKEALKTELDSLFANVREIIQMGKDHMSSQVCLVMVTETKVPNDVEQLARRYYRQKGFAFGLKGWANVMVIVVSLSDKRVITHKKNKKTAEFFEPEFILEELK